MDIDVKRKNSNWPLILSIVAILLLVIGWHIISPFLGLTLEITGIAWGVLVATTTLLCVSIILFFILGTLSIISVGIAASIWTVIAIVIFPIMFPIFVPLWIILLLVGIIVSGRP